MVRFMRYWFIYLIISSVVIIPGIFSMVKYGFKPAIDFTGGTLMELKLEKANSQSVEEIKKSLAEKELNPSAVQYTNTQSFIIRLKPISKNEHEVLTNVLTEKFGNIQEVRFETVGPTLGAELMRKTFIAASVAIVAILLYVAYAFKNIRFGVSAVIALFHDLLVVVGIFSILGKTLGVEVDSLFVTAVLTTMSFSVHDTIVVFDRIREYQKKHSGSYVDLIDKALTETMGRSVNNSLTIIFMLLALFLLGGETTKWFVLALLIGTISGTYSSPFVATPILYLWHNLRDRK